MTVADMQGLKQGQLKLAVITTVEDFIPRLLGPFCQRYPGLEATLEVCNREHILQRISDNLEDQYVFGHSGVFPRRAHPVQQTRHACSSRMGRRQGVNQCFQAVEQPLIETAEHKPQAFVPLVGHYGRYAPPVALTDDCGGQ